jgi:hypothetical protein
MSPLVASSPQQHDAGLARGAGDRGGSGIAAAAGSIGEAGRIVSELAQHPAAEDHAESGQTTQDLGVRVVAKACRQRALEVGERVLGRHQRGDDRAHQIEQNALETCVASLVAQNRGYSWGISHPLRAAVLPKPVVESRCDGVVPPRNDKVVGSIPTGGSGSPDCGPDSTRGARQRGVAPSACLGQHWQGGQAGTRPARAGRTGAGPGRRTAARPARHAWRIPLRIEVGRVPSLN